MDITSYHIDCNIHIKIAVLADVHGKSTPQMMDSIRKGTPDLIIIAGDFFDGKKIESSDKEAEILKGAVALTNENS